MPTVRKNQESSDQRRTMPEPLGVEPARDERRDGERERDRRRDVAEVEIRRMDRHPRILELRIHPAPVGRDEARGDRTGFALKQTVAMKKRRITAERAASPTAPDRAPSPRTTRSRCAE